MRKTAFSPMSPSIQAHLPNARAGNKELFDETPNTNINLEIDEMGGKSFATIRTQPNLTLELP